MKLAEALIHRADCQKRVEQLRQRLLRSAKVQEGEQPPEDPQALVEELARTLSELTGLVKRINKTNSATILEGSLTLSDTLAERDTIALKRNILSGLIETASVKQDRYSRSEVKYFSTINIAETQKQIDDLSKQYRELDSKIQETNWRVELIE